MSPASTTSPFIDVSIDSPWIIWKNQDQIIELTERIEENRHSSILHQPEIQPCRSSSEDATPKPLQAIQRNQYHNVLEKMSQACKKTGSFSSWTT